MTQENIVKRLHDASYSHATTTGDIWLVSLLNEAAGEIEYLRQRCEQIDHEWRESRRSDAIIRKIME